MKDLLKALSYVPLLPLLPFALLPGCSFGGHSFKASSSVTGPGGEKAISAETEDDGAKVRVRMNVPCDEQTNLGEMAAEHLRMLCVGRSYRIISPESFACEDGTFKAEVIAKCNDE